MKIERAFLQAMAAAGNPGRKRLQIRHFSHMEPPKLFRKARASYFYEVRGGQIIGRSHDGWMEQVAMLEDGTIVQQHKTPQPYWEEGLGYSTTHWYETPLETRKVRFRQHLKSRLIDIAHSHGVDLD